MFLIRDVVFHSQSAVVKPLNTPGWCKHTAFIKRINNCDDIILCASPGPVGSDNDVSVFIFWDISAVDLTKQLPVFNLF